MSAVPDTAVPAAPSPLQPVQWRRWFHRFRGQPGKADTSVQHLPVNLFGAVMGLSGLALAWRVAQVALGAPAAVADAIAVLAVGVFVLVTAGYGAKFVRHPAVVRAEFTHPVAGNFFGTIGISILLVAAVIAPQAPATARVVWTLGVLVTFALGFVVVTRLLQGRVDPAHAVPAWLIPGVATLDIAVTSGAMDMPWVTEVNLLAGAVGAMLALVLFALIVGRLVHRDPMAPAMTPSLMILVAPFAVGFLAYTRIAGGIDRFAAVLFYFGLFMFAVVAPTVFRRSVAFTPAWWAVGFPLAALANAALRYAAFTASRPLWLLAVALLGGLTLVLAWLSLRTLGSLFSGRLLRPA